MKIVHDMKSDVSQKPNSKTYKIAIVGGGLSGLSFGYYAKKTAEMYGFKCEIDVLEASDRLGGNVETIQTPYGLVHGGPHLCSYSPLVETFTEDHKIKCLFAKSKKKYSLQNSNDEHKLRLKRLFPSPLDGIALLYRMGHPSSTHPTPDNLQSYVYDLLGKKISNKIIRPVYNGVYACELDELSHRVFLSRVDNQVDAGNIVTILKHGYKSFRPEGGFKVFVDIMSQGLNIRLNEHVDDVSKIDADLVVVSVPAYAASKIKGIDADVQKKVAKVRYSSLDVTTIFTDKHIKKSGIGALSSGQSGIFGILFNNNYDRFDSYSIFSRDMNVAEVEAKFCNSFDVKSIYTLMKPYKEGIPIHDDNVFEIRDRYESRVNMRIMPPFADTFNNLNHERVILNTDYSGCLGVDKIFSGSLDRIMGMISRGG